MMRGGKRPGAGRKPAARRKVPHREREVFERMTPALVTIHMDKHVWNLRSQRSFNRLKRALSGGRDRFGTRIIHFSVQGNHLHLIVESLSDDSLYRSMTGLNVRIARRMNALMGRTGRVIAERYHAAFLRSRNAAFRAVRYVRENHRKHFAPKTDWRVGTTTDFFSSWAKPIELPLPKTTLLKWAEGPPLTPSTRTS
jgi:REP element-mobilizing transposase RayT